jgi:PAS domain S-box-containing protein
MIWTRTSPLQVNFLVGNPTVPAREALHPKDGTLVDILLSASILRGRDGAALYYIAQIEDITERKRAEEALQTSERELRELAESMPQIVWATSPDGRNIYFNQQWVDYTGLTLEESYGEGWIKPFHPDDRQRAWEAWQRAVQHRDIYSLECRLRRADGVYQWWLIQRSAAPQRQRADSQMVRHVHRH